ncbi:MAG: hypothetical protein JSV21_03585 [Nitrospirota bacterium]|nr:MAG: hypothetical protein JSV21_03585 [Nitrospirota bacterium]
MGEFDHLLDIGLFKMAHKEQKGVLKDFWSRGKNILEGSGVNIQPIPRSWLSFKRNYFSVLFIAMFHVLGIPKERLRFYSRINHCLRTWVTACDNLLDEELKELILTDLPSEARVFKSVHTILVADRIFFSYLIDAVKDGTITEDEMRDLVNVSLSAMTVSGREEAEEEGGVDYSTSPNEVLGRVHMAKTGVLFTSPLKAPLALGDIKKNDPVVKDVTQGLCYFGLGCQILDDLSDLGLDLYYRKHNYIASLIMSRNGKEKADISGLLAGEIGEEIKNDTFLYKKFPSASREAMKVAREQFALALDHLCNAGLPLNKKRRALFLNTLISIMGHPGLLLRLRG